MQAIAIAPAAFPQEDNDLANYDERIKSLETQTGNIRERLAGIEGKLQPKPNSPLITGLITIAATLFVAYWAWVGSQIVDHGKKLTLLLAPQELKETGSNPTNPANINRAGKLLADAKKHKRKFDTTIVSQTGERFLQASASDSQVWPAVLNFLDYRTFLNEDLKPQFANATAVTPNIQGGPYQFQLTIADQGLAPSPGHDVLSLTIRTSGKSSPATSARVELLSNPQPQGSGSAQIEIIGRADGIRLDGQYLKNVTVTDADVFYDGGSVKLENVLFVNCRFHFKNRPPARNLGQSILTADFVTFSKDAATTTNG
jgi:hypothetical protein